jgi:hypothetical protein
MPEKKSSNMKVTTQFIGHLTLPIEEQMVEKVKTTMRAHGATMTKFPTPDLYWNIWLPEGTQKIHDENQSKGRYSLVFPDGFRCVYIEPPRRRDRVVVRPPELHLDVQY